MYSLYGAKLLRMDPALYQPAAECGLRTFWMMAGVLDAKALKIKKLSYQGPFGVGYGVVSLRVTREDPRRSFAERYEMLEQRAMEERRAAEDDFVRLARSAVEAIVTAGEPSPLPSELPPEMTERAGVFVSLKKDGARSSSRAATSRTSSRPRVPTALHRRGRALTRHA